MKKRSVYDPCVNVINLDFNSARHSAELLDNLEKLYLGFGHRCTKDFQERIEAVISKSKGNM